MGYTLSWKGREAEQSWFTEQESNDHYTVHVFRRLLGLVPSLTLWTFVCGCNGSFSSVSTEEIQLVHFKTVSDASHSAVSKGHQAIRNTPDPNQNAVDIYRADAPAEMHAQVMPPTLSCIMGSRAPNSTWFIPVVCICRNNMQAKQPRVHRTVSTLSIRNIQYY